MLSLAAGAVVGEMLDERGVGFLSAGIGAGMSAGRAGGLAMEGKLLW